MVFKKCKAILALSGFVFLMAASSTRADYAKEFIDLKNYFSQTSVKQAKAEALMRYMPPPYFDRSMLSGDNYKQLEKWAQAKKVYLRSDLSEWDTYNDPDNISENGVIQKHFKDYCSQGDVYHNLCKPPKGQEATAIPYDLNAASLFEYPTLLNMTLTREDGTVVPFNMDKAAKYYIRNLTNPVPLTLLPDDDMFKNKSKGILSEEGKSVLSAIYKQQVVLSLAQESLMSIYADRLPFQPQNPTEDSKYNPALNNKSRNEILKEDALRRYTDQDWYLQMNQTSTEGLLREIANMMALQLAVNQRNSERLERMEAIMAAKLGMDAQSIGMAEKGRQAGDQASSVPDNF